MIVVFQGFSSQVTELIFGMRTFAENQLKNLTPDALIGDSSVHRLMEEGLPSDLLTRCAETDDIDMVAQLRRPLPLASREYCGRRLLERRVRRRINGLHRYARATMNGASLYSSRSVPQAFHAGQAQV